MMSRFRLLLALCAVLPLLAVPSAAETVGTAAAVNTAAHGLAPGGTIRALTLGSNIVENERITTDDAGLVQVLFADGTTLTVGPRSDLVIDRYIYDPNRNTAEMAATMTKGVLRFIGGIASKGENGVSITVPTGTIGIRGAIADISLGGGGSIPPHVDMLFGSEVTFSQGLDLLGRLYQSGYSLVLGANGGVSVVKTPPEWTSQIQQALAGGPGTNGGARQQPTNQTVASSGVPDSNSANGVEQNGGPPPIVPLTQQEIDQLLAAVQLYEELKEIIEETPQGTTLVGAGAGIVRIDNYDGAGVHTETRWPPAVTTGASFATANFAAITFDGNGNVLAGTLDVTTQGSSCTGCRLQVQLDATGAKVSAVDSSGNYVTVEATGAILDHSAVTLPAGVDYCECSFLEWGFWNVAARVNDNAGLPTDITVDKGTWVAGVPTSAADLETLGVQELAGTSATFRGHAIGTASTSAGPSYLAAGQVDMTWSFANRHGTLAITGFDGRDYSGLVESDGTQFFTASLAGTVPAYQLGVARGAFANNGTIPAAGVAGDFLLTDLDWSAAGIFVAERGPDTHETTSLAYGTGVLVATADSMPVAGMAFPAAIDIDGIPYPSTVTLDESGAPTAFTFYLNGGYCGASCLLTISGSAGTGIVTVFDVDGVPLAGVPVTASILGKQDVNLPPGTIDCTCAFANWGTWSAEASYQDPMGGPSYWLEVENAFWLAGDVTTPSQLASLASTSAQYQGTAIGGATTWSESGTTTEMVSGNLSVDWSFGSRSGTIGISDLAGRDFLGQIDGIDGTPYFAGSLHGTSEDQWGYASGNFFNGGGLADGVGGSFSVFESTSSDLWNASGIFMGDRVSP